MNLQPTNYSLWWALSSRVVVYLPTREEDCGCLDENLRNQEPKSLLERSLFFLHREEFAESKSPPQPILREWRGVLPSCSPFKHLLRLTKLTGWEGKDKNNKPIVPFKIRGMSHEIHCLYHPKRDSSCLRLLFRVQIGAPQEIALQLGTKVAAEMSRLTSHQGHLLLRPTLTSYRSDRWGDFIDCQLEELLKFSGKQP